MSRMVKTQTHRTWLAAADKLERLRGIGLPVIVAVGVGTGVLMVGGLPTRIGLLILGGLLLPAAALLMPSPRRFLEIGLMLSFGVNMDVHLWSQPHIVDPMGIPVSLTGSCTVLLIGWWFIEGIGTYQSRGRLFGGLGWPILGLWAMSLCSLFVSTAPRFGLFALINLAYFTALFVYLANAITTREHLRSVIAWLLIAVGLTSVAAIAEYSLDRTGVLSMLGLLAEEDTMTLVSAAEVKRAGGLLGAANGLATVLAQLLPLMLTLFLTPVSGLRKAPLALGLAVGVLALIATYSRGGWLAFAVVVPMAIGLMSTGHVSDAQKASLKKAVLLLLMLAALAAPLYGNIYTRLTEDDLGSAQSRWPMMRVAWRMIQDNPLFGVGLSNYEEAMFRYDQGSDRIHQFFPWPVHNIYLNITAEIGIIGGLCFLLVCGLSLWQGVRAMRAPDPFLRATAIGLMTGLIAYLLIGLKELGPLGSSRYRHFWLAVGLLVATRKIAETLVQKQQSVTFDRLTAQQMNRAATMAAAAAMPPPVASSRSSNLKHQVRNGKQEVSARGRDE